MTTFHSRTGRPRCWALSLLGSLSIATSGLAQAQPAGTRAEALQSCPSVEEEIVDLDMLAEGLKKTDAVSLFEKVRLKSSIDGLISRLKAYHGGARAYSLAQLQQQYDLLLMRIAAHLQHKDELLHGRLCNAWEPIWQELSNNGKVLKTMS
jgi:hypothetical protein